MKSLNKYKKIVFFDLETTSLDEKNGKVVEFGAKVYINGKPENEYNILVNPGIPIPNSDIHGITDEMVQKDGITYQAYLAIVNTLFTADDDSLYVAYNTNFDMTWIVECLVDKNLNFNLLDIMAIYKDRYKYCDTKDTNGKKLGHRLDSMVTVLGLSIKNTHRSIDDVNAMMQGLYLLSQEKDNLDFYVNKFGFNDRYGVSGIKFPKVQYIPQGFYGNREIENSVKKVKSYDGAKEYVLATTGVDGSLRYWAADQRIDGLNKPTLFSRSIFKLLSINEAEDLLESVRKQYNANKHKERNTRANNLKVLKVTMNEL